MLKACSPVYIAPERRPESPSKLEAVGISSEFAPGVLVAQMAGGISFAFGAAIAVSKKTIEAIGGFAAIAPYLADDYMMGNLVRKAGLPVKLSRYVVETVLSKLSISGFIRHQLRWARGIRACAPWGHTGSLITNGTALSFLYFLFSGFSRFGLLIFASVTRLKALDGLDGRGAAPRGQDPETQPAAGSTKRFFQPFHLVGSPFRQARGVERPGIPA